MKLAELAENCDLAVIRVFRVGRGLVWAILLDNGQLFDYYATIEQALIEAEKHNITIRESYNELR